MVLFVAYCSVFDPDLLNTEFNGITDPRRRNDSSIGDSDKRDAAAGSDSAISENGSNITGANADADDKDTRLDSGLIDAGMDAVDINAEQDADIDDPSNAEIYAGEDAGSDTASDVECVLIPDSDSELDCCPDDSNKTEPGVCGCGVEDSDRDSDEVADCLDECPEDPDKTEPGACGCGTLDLDDDSDAIANCLDDCPQDPGKSEPGICGCGWADTQTGCIGLRDALIHRYSFTGSGTTVTDSVGGADGTIVNTELTDSGSLDLAGTTTDQYVDLPNGLLSELVNASFEVWVTWNGGDGWQRIFDFGSNVIGEGEQGPGATYISLTPKNGFVSNAISFAYANNGNISEVWIEASGSMQTGVVTHVVAVIDALDDRMRLYVDGEADPAGGILFIGSLSQINDVNNWLGRSQYSTDPEFGGSLHEFRIYDRALSAEQIQKSYAAGPDPHFID